MVMKILNQEKRKISDSFLWQKPLHQHENPKRNVTTQKRHQNFDYTTIEDWLRTVSWSNSNHPRVFFNLPTNRNKRVIKRTYIKKCVNSPPSRDWGPTTNQIREGIKMWYTNISMNITTHPGEINYRKPRVIAFVVNDGLNITTNSPC